MVRCATVDDAAAADTIEDEDAVEGVAGSREAGA
jgi:hypothetical protein